LILDVDAHHGNGTQEIFYKTSKVLYISIHQDPREFPGTGFTDEIGEGEGLGYTVNIPLPFGTNDKIYLKAVNEIVKPITRQYKPQFILVSAGLDGHYMDPVGRLSLSVPCYQEVYETIVNLASETCRGKLVSVLEGGYSLNFVGKIAAAALAKMSRAFYNVDDEADEIYLKAVNEVVKPIARQYKPQFMLVSAGLDGHYMDPVGRLSLSVPCYQEVYETIVNLASETCRGKLVSVLEGGYSLNFVGKIAAVALAKMSRAFFNVDDEAPTIKEHIKQQGEGIIREVKRVQKAFWNL